MPLSNEQSALVHLLACGARASALRRLLDTHGSAEAALAAGPHDWASHGLEPAARQRLRASDYNGIQGTLRWLEAPDHHLLGWSQPDYPPLLRRGPSPPTALFVAGDPCLLWRPTIAVVGSRAATAGGRSNAALFARALSKAGLCVASGLAAGIDAAAHQATLAAGGATLAVLGTGPDIAYPVQHRPLLEEIARTGAVVSEHLPGTGPLRQHFPSRNRILAGLSVGTLVIEAAERSGALITARLAADAGREVFALPGSIHNPMARGSHRLIREGATLVQSPEDVLEVLAPLVLDLAKVLRGSLQDLPAAAQAAPEPADGASGDYNLLWNALGHDPTGMDELVGRTGLTAAELSAMLLTLELEGRVAAEHGRYARIGA